jgi:hypothetical protein
MRITVTLDEDVARLVEREQRRTRSSIEEVLNKTLRAALSPKSAHAESCSTELSGIAAPRQPR